MQSSCLITFKIMQKQPPEKFCKKVVLKSFAIFTEKDLCWIFFCWIQNIAKFLRTLLLRTSANGCFWKCSWNWQKLKTVDKGFWPYINFSTSVSGAIENIYLFVFILWLVSFRVCIYINSSLMWWEMNIYTRVDKKKIKSSRK